MHAIISIAIVWAALLWPQEWTYCTKQVRDAPYLGSSTQSSGLESLGSSISSGGLKEGLKSSNKEPLFLLSPSMSTSYLQTRPGAVVTMKQAD